MQYCGVEFDFCDDHLFHLLALSYLAPFEGDAGRCVAAACFFGRC